MTSLTAIRAEGLLAVGAMLLLTVPFLRPRWMGLGTLGLLAAALYEKGTAWSTGPALFFSGMLAQDRLAIFLQSAILGSAILVVLTAVGWAREEIRGRREFYALLLFAVVGQLLMVGAQNLALVYVGLELVSILSYLLIGFQKRETLSIEGALKYFLFGALSTGAMLYGISILYGLLGTLDLAAIGQGMPLALNRAPFLSAAALFLITAGLAFKLALVPFHMWAPDAYEGGAVPAVSFISLGPKIAGFGVLLRIFLLSFSPQTAIWPALFSLLALLTMTLANGAALHQTNVKRLLAYSSIAHAGTMLIGAAVATPFGMAALLYYLVAYVLMNAGAFAGMAAVSGSAGPAGLPAARREDLSSFSGLSQQNPFLAAMLAICLLSLAGIPPLGGFFAKMWIFAAAMEGKALWLAVAAAVNSVIALFYYVKILKTMYLDPAPARSPVPLTRAHALTLAFCAFGLFALGLWQGPWLKAAAASVPPRAGSAALPWLTR